MADLMTKSTPVVDPAPFSAERWMRAAG
jgi:hypothetical protein